MLGLTPSDPQPHCCEMSSGTEALHPPPSSAFWSKPLEGGKSDPERQLSDGHCFRKGLMKITLPMGRD